MISKLPHWEIRSPAGVLLGEWCCFDDAFDNPLNNGKNKIVKSYTYEVTK